MAEPVQLIDQTGGAGNAAASPPPRENFVSAGNAAPYGRDLYPTLDLGGSEPDTTVPPADPFSAWNDLTAAAIRRENALYSVISQLNANAVDPYEKEPGFDFQKAARDAGNDQYMDRYAAVFNQRAADALTAKINQEKQDRRTIQAAGAWGGLSQTAGWRASVSLPNWARSPSRRCRTWSAGATARWWSAMRLTFLRRFKRRSREWSATLTPGSSLSSRWT
jgi:hypothetical protein